MEILFRNLNRNLQQLCGLTTCLKFKYVARDILVWNTVMSFLSKYEPSSTLLEFSC